MSEAELVTAPDTAPESVAEQLAKQPARTSVDVLFASGQVARTYNLADHGENFADLAAEYAAKIGGTVR